MAVAGHNNKLRRQCRLLSVDDEGVPNTEDGIKDTVFHEHNTDSSTKNTIDEIRCSLSKSSHDSNSNTGINGKSGLDHDSTGCNINNALLNGKDLTSNDGHVINVNRKAALNGSDTNVQSEIVNKCKDGSKHHCKLAHRRIPLGSRSDEHDDVDGNNASHETVNDNNAGTQDPDIESQLETYMLKTSKEMGTSLYITDNSVLEIEQEKTDVVSEALLTESKLQSTEGYQRSESTDSTGGFQDKLRSNDPPTKHDIYVQFPNSTETFPVGLIISTQIYSGKRRKREWAEHTVDRVAAGGIADQLGLRPGNKLLKVSDIMADGMNGDLLVAQFLALDIYDISVTIEQHNANDEKHFYTIWVELQVDLDTDIKGLHLNCTPVKTDYIVPQTDKTTEGIPENRRSSTLSIGSSFHSAELKSVDSLGIGVFSKLDVTHPKVVDLENDLSDEYKVAHDKETKPCRIEHPSSNQYLRFHGNKLVLAPLQKKDKNSLFRRGRFGCYDDEKQPHNVFVFREMLPSSTSYVSALGINRVGIQDFKQVMPTAPRVLNADDPRLFQHTFAGISDCFMATCLKDHYLAVVGSNVCLKLVLKGDIFKDTDIHFQLDYIDT